MRRGSIVAPIILILIGVLFLMSNLRPDVPLLEHLGRYWPFLLIGWGLVRLLEIVVWAVRGRPLPANGVSGGEWVLVIFLSLIGTTLYAFHSHGWGPARFRVHGIEMFGEAYDFALDERKVPAANVKRVIIENLRGNTRVVGGDVAEVRVSGRKTIRALSHGKAEKDNNTTELELIEQGDTVLVRTNQNRAEQERYVSADLEIAVPRSVALQMRGRFGDVEVQGITGGLDVDSDNAGVRVQDIGGDLRVNLRRSDIVRAINVKGQVELQGRGEDVELENVQGQVTIEGSWGGELQFRRLALPVRFEGSRMDFQAQGVQGEVRVGRGFVSGESVTGPVIVRGHSKGCCDVRLEGFTTSVDVEVDRGDVQLQPGSPFPKIAVQLDSGDVELAIPEGAKFNMNARVEKGEVRNEYGDQLQISGSDRGGVLTGTVGQGAAVSIVTGRGTVTVRKGNNLPPLTPVPPKAPLPPESPEQI